MYFGKAAVSPNEHKGIHNQTISNVNTGQAKKNMHKTKIEIQSTEGTANRNPQQRNQIIAAIEA